MARPQPKGGYHRGHAIKRKAAYRPRLRMLQGTFGGKQWDVTRIRNSGRKGDANHDILVLLSIIWNWCPRNYLAQ